MKKFVNLAIWIFLLAIIIMRSPSWLDAFNNEGNPAPEITVSKLLSETDEKLTLPIKDGRPSILIFWASWCPPCKLELSRIQDAINSNELNPKRVFAISIDQDKMDAIKAVKERGYTFVQLIDSNSVSANTFKVAATPTIINISSDGKIDWIGTGISPTLIYRTTTLFK